MIFKYYSVDQISEARQAEYVPSVIKENIRETIQLQNLKTKDQFEEYGTCGTVGDVKMDVIETLRLGGMDSTDTEYDRKYWRSYSKKARNILIHKMM